MSACFFLLTYRKEELLLLICEFMHHVYHFKQKDVDLLNKIGYNSYIEILLGGI